MTAMETLLVSTTCLCLLSGSNDLPDEVRFNRDIRPIMSNICFQCHGPDAENNPSELRLDSFESATATGALVPFNVSKSEIARRIQSDDPDVKMPPADFRRRLSPKEVKLILRWIEQGGEYEPHWVYAPLRRPEVPKVEPADKVRNEIDSFIQARLRAEGLAPSDVADGRTLVRRLSLDLLGLPPDPETVEAFLANQSPDRYETLVDSLLSSPHFGERMAVYWLDLVRYADTCGIHGDQEVTISSYRDYVIKSFNDNKPFDEFTIEQLAGDLLENPTISDLMATGFNRLNLTSHEGGVQDKEYLAKYAADRVRAVSNVWLGATMGCAECHDHKFDPYTMRDFYSMQAFFADVEESGDYSIIARKYGVRKSIDTSPTARPPTIDAPPYALIDAVDRIQQSDLSEQEKQAALAELKGEFRPTLVTKSVEPRTIRILPRGDWLDDSGEVVEPAVPTFMPNQPEISDRRLTRMDLARWLVAADNPVTARVFVNRMWKLFFGTGLSKVLDDLGNQGESPSHPDLLDWLACEFRDGGWDVKRLVKLMVLSHTYQQSSHVSKPLRERDPYNRLLARQSRWRLDAEFIRDNALKVSGLLVADVGGPSVRPYQPVGYWDHLNFPTRTYTHSVGPEQYRRGVYTHWQRLFLHPSLAAFDAPSREECVAERTVSNTPLAALVSLNDPTYVEAARVLAERMLREGGETVEAKIAFLYRQALARAPGKHEADVLLKLVEEELQHYQGHSDEATKLTTVGLHPPAKDLPAPELAAWTQAARTVLSLHETITRP